MSYVIVELAVLCVVAYLVLRRVMYIHRILLLLREDYRKINNLDEPPFFDPENSN
jgi:hypothetical protein